MCLFNRTLEERSNFKPDLPPFPGFRVNQTQDLSVQIGFFVDLPSFKVHSFEVK